jgi:hypothetical protein
MKKSLVWILVLILTVVLVEAAITMNSDFECSNTADVNSCDNFWEEHGTYNNFEILGNTLYANAARGILDGSNVSHSYVCFQYNTTDVGLQPAYQWDDTHTWLAKWSGNQLQYYDGGYQNCGSTHSIAPDEWLCFQASSPFNVSVGTSSSNMTVLCDLTGVNYDDGLSDYTIHYDSGPSGTVRINEICGGDSIADCLDGADNTAPNITQFNFTSDGGEICGNGITCGPTLDTTPTFKITTDETADCRISDTNDNYATMNSSRDCSTTGATSHTCTVTTQDALGSGLDDVYFACKDGSGNENTTGVKIDISNSQGAIREAIDKLLPSATVRTNQQVYIRYVNNTQRFGTFDNVASLDGKRWLFNHITGSDTFTNIGSIGTTINVWENNTVMSYAELENAAEDFINSTR